MIHTGRHHGKRALGADQTLDRSPAASPAVEPGSVPSAHATKEAQSAIIPLGPMPTLEQRAAQLGLGTTARKPSATSRKGVAAELTLDPLALPPPATPPERNVRPRSLRGDAPSGRDL